MAYAIPVDARAPLRSGETYGVGSADSSYGFVKNIQFTMLGDQTILVWSQQSAEGSGLYATPVADDGRPVIPNGRQVHAPTGTSSDRACNAADSTPVVWRGDEQLHVTELYMCDSELEGRELARKGFDKDGIIGPYASRFGDLSVVAFTNRRDGAATLLLNQLGAVSTSSIDIELDATMANLVGLACSDAHCVVAFEDWTGEKMVVRLVSFVPDIHADELQIDATLELQRSGTTLGELRLGESDSRIMASIRETTPGELLDVLTFATLTDDLEVIDLVSHRLSRGYWVHAEPPLEYNGRRVAEVGTANSYDYSSVSGLARFGPDWEWYETQPLTMEIDGSRFRPVAYAYAPSGGIYAVARHGKFLTDPEASALYVQVLGIPGEAGARCWNPADCESLRCSNRVCFEPPESSEPDEGAVQDSTAKGGCQHASPLRPASLWPPILALTFFVVWWKRARISSAHGKARPT